MKRKSISILLALVLVISFSIVTAAPAGAATITVGTEGDYTTIQDAIDAAEAGDTITVAAGTYTEDLVVNIADLTIQSVDGAGTTIIQLVDGVGIDIQGGASGFVLGGAEDMGFTILGNSENTTYDIQLANAPSDVTISYNTIDTTGHASMGISIGAAGATGLTIDNNTFTGAETNLGSGSDGSIWGPKMVDVTISDNTFTGTATPDGGYAVEFAGVTGTSTISGNTITNYGMGVAVFNGEGTSGLTISDNTITGCTNGIRLGQYSPTTNGNMTTVTVSQNTLTTNTIGIRINDGANVLASNFVVEDNNISGSTTWGLQNQHASQVVTAKYNWWGDASGPANATSNPEGTGDAVTDHVDFAPWLDAAYPEGEPAGYPVNNVTQGQGYETIGEAVDAANPGDTITVAAGTYVENVVIDKALTLQGEEDAEIAPTTACGVEIQASDVTVDGFTITTLGLGAHGIFISVGATGLTLTGNDITIGGYSTAIYADAGALQTAKSSGWVISGNTLSAAEGCNLELYDVDDVTIDDNDFMNTAGSNVIVSSELFDLTGPIVFTNNDVQGNDEGSMVAFVTDFQRYITDTRSDDITTAMDDVTITGNTFDGWPVAARGLRIGDWGGDVTNVVVNYNEFLATGTALANNDDAEIDAENNYWGSANGPEHNSNKFNVGSQGGAIVDSNNVDYVPWLDDYAPDGVSFAPVNSEDGIFSSIQAAIDAATHTTITCAAGTYSENLYIDKSLTLLGAGADVTTIDGDDEDVIYITLDSGDVTVSGFSVIDGMFGIHLADIVNGSSVNINHNIIAENWLCGIRGSYTGVDASSVTIEDNEITANDLSGISFYDVTGESTLNIFDNIIYGNGEQGVKVTYLTDDSALTITGNTIGGWEDEYDNYNGNYYEGIYIGYVEDSTVTIGGNTAAEGNTINGNLRGHGIYVDDADNSIFTIEGNQICWNGWDSYWGRDGIQFYYVEDDNSITILNNDILENYDCGIQLFSGDPAGEGNTVDVHYNSIVGNGSHSGDWYGLNVESSGVTVDARYNWWGDAAGPYDDWSPDGYYNPYQLLADLDSDYVYGDVIYTPWLIQSELAEGWNIWSMPIAGDPDSMGQIGADLLEAGCDAIYYFDSDTQYWGADPADANPMDAFYIHILNPVTLRYCIDSDATFPPQKAMKVGWNFIGLNQLYYMEAGEALVDIYFATGGPLPGYSKVICPSLNGESWTYLWEGGGGYWMYPGMGYWVFMVNDGVLGGFTTTPIVEVTGP